MSKAKKRTLTEQNKLPKPGHQNFGWPHAGQIELLDIKRDEVTIVWDVEVKQSANKFSKYRPYATNVKNPVAAAALAKEAVKRTGLKARIRKTHRRETNIRKIEVMRTEIIAFHHKTY